MWFNGVLYTVGLFLLHAECQKPIIRTQYGAIQPLLRTSRNGRRYEAYLGIPFARPPVGPLRFLPPQYPAQWVGVRQSAYGPSCAQFDLGSFSVIGEEDCLYLNVFRPEPRVYRNEKLPVMVFIHGGAFMFFSGTNYYPAYFMDEPVILVTFNYRVGVLGFLNAGVPEAQGNMGLKDQVMALEWVRNNIGSFGGDPEAITIFGDLAGGASVHYHMYSDMSKGLFSAAISQSGTALCSWAYIPNPLEVAQQLSNHVGHPTEDMKELVAVLNTLNTTALVGAIPRFFEFGVNPINPFGVSIEMVEKGYPRFLSNSPYMTLQREPPNNVPWMVGVNDQLGLWAASNVVADPEQVRGINEDWLTLAPLLFYYRELALDPNTVSALIRSEYFPNNVTIGRNTLPDLADLYGDRLFYHGDRKSILSHFTNTQKNKQPTYLYHFSFHSNNSIVRLTPVTETLGVTEGDDLQYLFETPFPFFQNITANHGHYYFSTNLVRLWAHFATHRTMDGAMWKDQMIDWQPADTQAALRGRPLRFLDINERLGVIDEPFKSRLDFWDALPINEYENEILPHV